MPRILFKAVPYRKEQATLALESGVDALIVPDAALAAAQGLSRNPVFPQSAVAFIRLAGKADEARALALAAGAARQNGPAAGRETCPRLVVLERGWEVIPLENLLAAGADIAVEAGDSAEAALARGVLERGADTVVLTPDAVPMLKEIVDSLKYSAGQSALEEAVITRITPAGMGHRVCVDTLSLMQSGQGMLVGNSAAFTFLVNAETEHNEYVAARPFRINAGGVHAYALLPGDRTCYLEELHAGSEVLLVDGQGRGSIATVGRVKVERRPMLLLEARPAERDPAETQQTGSVFLQNAETIRLVTPDGAPISVVDIRPGDRVLCRLDEAGRHFGMRIQEDIREK